MARACGSNINAPLKSFIEFMRIDTDLITIAAENSVAQEPQVDRNALKTWITNLPEREKDDILFRMFEEPGPHLGAELKQRFQQTVSAESKSEMRKQLRSVEELNLRAETYAEERKRRTAEKRARKRAQEKKERKIMREKYLNGLAEREDSIWKNVDEFIDSKQPKKYDEAVKLLVDLRDLSKQKGKERTFDSKLKRICDDHHRKVTFITRLQKVGLTD